MTELVFTDTGWEQKTYVMGIINATPDSFSGDGINGNIEAGVSQALRFYSEGADILDIGDDVMDKSKIAKGSFLEKQLKMLGL